MEAVTCLNCGRLQCNQKLKCSRCKKAYYCDTDCQKSHWHKEHKYHCISGEEENKRNEFNAILKNDGIIQIKTKQLENVKWECYGELLSMLTTKYGQHYSLLVSGYIRMNVEKQDRENKINPWVIHKQHKYPLKRANMILLLFKDNDNNKESSVGQVLFNLIWYFMTPPLMKISSTENEKIIKTEYFRECIEIIETKFDQQKCFVNNIGYCLVHNTLTSCSLKNVHCDCQGDEFVWQVDKFPETFKDHLKLFMLMLVMGGKFDKMVLLLSNNKTIKISPAINDNNYYYEYKLDDYYDCKNGNSTLFFEFESTKKEKVYSVGKYYINPSVFGNKCRVQKGMIYGINQSELLKNITDMIYIHGNKMLNSLLIIES